MAEGTQLARLEEAVKEGRLIAAELQRTQEVSNERLSQLDRNFQEQQEAMQNMEAVLRNLVQTSVSVSQSPRLRDEVSQGVGNEQQTLLSKTIKVDIPYFDGNEAEDWVFKIQEFFEIYGTPEQQRIKLVSFHMTGAAYAWYK